MSPGCHSSRATVRACIAQLPDNYRAVLMLRDIEERSTQEVADALSMTPTDYAIDRLMAPSPAANTDGMPV